MKARFRDGLNIRYFEEYGVRSIKYCAEVRHSELNEYRLITASEEYLLKNKIDAFLAKLRDKWEKFQIKNSTIYTKESGLKQAELRTNQAKQALQDVEETLLFTLGVDDTVSWDSLKNHSPFPTPHPKNSLALRVAKLKVPPSPEYLPIPQEPVFISPTLGLLDKLIKSIGDKKIAKAQHEYEALYHA
ncbi:hypothetical protein [Spirosoma aerolatum]|uniref:hypothetical protein n=1 Tax=Spirosoma aerolatum TaxID=1211326 RepID=UPI001C54E7C6|nr:hypothetical protein [Spirosoma aerolatum]